MMDYQVVGKKLSSRLSELTSRAEAIEEELRSPLDADSSEQAVDLADDEALAGTDEVIRQEISEIRAALLRIENGSYGICSVCGSSIGHARLDALPTATRCINCA
ncbi:TraR/DksA family transcriptional regulator [Sphingobium sp. TKS]|uniref:TraR/DksA family transcriptional regulator n=1 Tax=Sphingobium sp. TKS TaxID=1315974 RepID=UPI0008379865|nr:TraR/DksA family transcriptional regulator [Sphingobium sp. TKS]